MEMINVEPIEQPKPFSESPVNLKRCEDVMEIMQSLRWHWPLTVRSVYYKVISSPNYMRPHWRSQRNRHLGLALANPEEQVGEILKHLRLTDQLSWIAINDTSRIVTTKRGSVDFEDHINSELAYINIGYFDRCKAADQENYLEVWVEKNGLVHIAQDVADRYCRRTAGCKGFPSVSFLHSYTGRARAAQRAGQEVIILYFGDLDPSGWLIPKTIKASLLYEHGLDVEVVRCGLNPSDILEDMVSIKLSGKKPIKEAFVAETGLTVGYELDLLDPNDLQEMVKDALDMYTNHEALEMADILAAQNNAEIEKINDELDEVVAPIREKYGR